ncbi:MAG: carboxypeptidase regulatory-like domain-containing protein, partial [Thermoplasmatales archaeon]|nr:carboxypeptidase regulatory-like domain-containing protein [Thermoplasmatales archaeon]
TDENGTYTITYDIGNYRMELTKGNYEKIDTYGYGGIMTYPGRTNTMDFYMKPSPMPSTGNLTGRVYDLVTELPLNATLKFGTQTVTTDANGTYFVTRTAGVVTVIVNSTGYENITAKIYIPVVRTTTYDFYLTLVSGNGTLKGTVINKETNAPVANAQITLYSGYPNPLKINTTTNSNGNYSVVLPSRTYAMNINASGYVTYDASVTVYAEQTATRKIYLEKFGIEATRPAEFEIESLPLDTTFFLGERATMKFRIRNIGDMIGKVQVNLTIPGIYENVNYTWIKPGVEEDIMFTFTVPDDLEEKEYKMYYVIDGTEYEKRMSVVGMNVSVDAGLDKKMYLAGDNAVLTLNVTNLKDFNVSLFSRVKFNGYDNVTCFNLTGFGNKTLTFYVPVKEFSGDKLFYSVYTESGRALYINALYIYQKPEGDVVLYTDKQVYEMGESVTITTEAMVGGTLNITAPGFSENITVGGTKG